MFRRKKTRLKYFGIRSYFRHAYYHLKHAFIPHEHNNHYPHALRTHALVTYGVFLIALKVVVTSILFISFPDAAKLSAEQIEQIFRLTNESRIENNLSALTIDPYLTSVAESKASDMSEKKYFSHYTPEGFAPWFFIDEDKYNYELAGENLAMNFVEMNSVQRAFMASPGHRDNILHPGFRDVGYAIALAEINGEQTQILVEYFGTRKSSARTQTLVLNTTETTIEDPTPLKEKPLANTATAEPIVAQEIIELSRGFFFSDELIIFASSIAEKSAALKFYDFSHQLFIYFLAFVAISLLVNVIVKMRVQHGRLLLQSSLLILLIVAIIFTRFHFLEDINVSLQIY